MLEGEIIIRRVNGHWPAEAKMAARVWAEAYMNPDDPMVAEDLFDALEFIMALGKPLE